MYARARFPLVTALVLAFAYSTTSAIHARPFRGSTPIHVLLCQTADSGAAPRTVAHYQNLLFNRNTGGLATGGATFRTATSITAAQAFTAGRWTQLTHWRQSTALEAPARCW